MPGSDDQIKKLLRVLRKLDNPPAGPNWVRFIHSADPIRTAKSIIRFAKGQPPFNYQSAYRGIKDRIELSIDLNAALLVASKKVAPSGLLQNRELVEAFFRYDEERRYSSSNPVGFDVEYFRVSRDVIVPVAPLSIIREKGKFVPIFLCGWTSNPLLLVQRRLLMTIYEDAFLSLTDYLNSPAEVLFFPKYDGEDEAGALRREPELWPRGCYELLQKRDLDECVEVFISAREIAREVLLAEIEDLRKKAQEQDQPSAITPSGTDLFEE
ncbi:MAG TPA: hypothetical protein VH206_19165 [Xanthobacteraceae bacterium]|jgi:hypothetical protein|nr:hypothetical protein [Xanthobacteraceae bacterium]